MSEVKNDKIYYDWSVIDGYQCPIKIVISRRGLGKTFGKIRRATEKNITKERRFIYVVETGEMVDELARNRGEKFWSALLDYYGEQNTSRKRYFYKKLTKIEVENEKDEDNFFRNETTAISGGTIKINGKTAGYIVDLNSFANLKRNNFVNISDVIVDEFISEKIDKTTLENPRKISSIIQSIARLKDINIYMLGNSVRLTDPILARIGFKLKDYGIYKKYDKFGLVAVLHYVNPDDYKGFAERHEKSVAGRFASLLKETNEEENKFMEDLPESCRLQLPIKYKKTGFYVNLVKDNTLLTIKELDKCGYAVIPFSGKNVKNLFCMTEKEQGFKLGYHIICNKLLKQSLLNMMRANVLKYYSEIEYAQLKYIIKGD